jgi:outer membrane protein TolC
LIADMSFTSEGEYWEPTDSLEAEWKKPDRAESLQKAVVLRPDLLFAKLEVEKQGIIARYHYNQMFPALDLEGSYGGLAVEHKSRAETFETIGNFTHPVYGVGVVLKVPLGNNAARNNYKASKEAKEQALLRLKKVEQDVFVQVDDAVKGVESAYGRVSAARKAREYAEEALAGERELLDASKSTPLAVSEFESKVAATRLAEALAIVNYNKAQHKLAFQDGTILEKNLITLQFE